MRTSSDRPLSAQLSETQCSSSLAFALNYSRNTNTLVNQRHETQVMEGKEAEEESAVIYSEMKGN
jgi:hypothetical protein